MDEFITAETNEVVLYDDINLYDDVDDADGLEFFMEDVLAAIRFQTKDSILVCHGSVGRWDGTYAGGDICRDIDAVMAQFNGCDYFRFVDVSGELHIIGVHHDGQVHMHVKILTDAGFDAITSEYGYDYRHNRAANELVFWNPEYSRDIRMAQDYYREVAS